MDNLTHSLVGALIGQAGLKRRTGLAMPALILGANLPDVDAACFFWLDGVEHLGFRRGITHGPIAWVLLPLVLAGLLWGFDRWQAKRGTRPEGRKRVNFGWLLALAFLACLTHPALDWLNVYGIRLLEPFSSRWFYGDVLFIIDVWLWVGLGFATWFSLRREKRDGDWKRPARIALAIAGLYVFANGLVTRDAEGSLVPSGSGQEVIANPPPLAFWKRELLTGAPGAWSQADYSVLHGAASAVPLAPMCANLPEPRSDDRLARGHRAFLFWSRAPFAEPAPDGSVLLRDARFYDPRARDRFTVALPDVECVPPNAPPRGEGAGARP